LSAMIDEASEAIDVKRGSRAKSLTKKKATLNFPITWGKKEA